ncbi:MAG: GNAT family N-acetyltransferase [Egibacteraceae bacterium]
MSENVVRVNRVPAGGTRPFRQATSCSARRRTLADLEASDECLPEPGYFAAVQGDSVVATASARPERPQPSRTAARHPWRIRAVVTAERFQRRGLGTRLLREVLAHVRRNGGDLVWCNVRASAVSFYERFGFHVCGPVWDDPHTGPHTSMRMQVNAGWQAGCSRPPSSGTATKRPVA